MVPDSARPPESDERPSLVSSSPCTHLSACAAQVHVPPARRLLRYSSSPRTMSRPKRAASENLLKTMRAVRTGGMDTDSDDDDKVVCEVVKIKSIKQLKLELNGAPCGGCRNCGNGDRCAENQYWREWSKTESGKTSRGVSNAKWHECAAGVRSAERVGGDALAPRDAVVSRCPERDPAGIGRRSPASRSAGSA